MARNPACDPPYLRQWDSYRDVPFHLEQHVRQAKKTDQEYAKKESQKIIDDLSVPCELMAAEYHFRPAMREGHPIAACAQYNIIFKAT
jgi:tagatose-1,6-bisphosphate aldolase